MDNLTINLTSFWTQERGLQWAWWTAAVIAANYREEEETARLTLQLEAQLRCAAAASLLRTAAAAASTVYDRRALLAAGDFIHRDNTGQTNLWSFLLRLDDNE